MASEQDQFPQYCGRTPVSMEIECEKPEMERKIAALEARLAALEWQEITPENLPKVGDEVLRLRVGISGYPWQSVETVMGDDTLTAKDWNRYKYTHRRLLNPPAQAPKKERKQIATLPRRGTRGTWR